MRSAALLALVLALLSAAVAIAAEVREPVAEPPPTATVPPPGGLDPTPTPTPQAENGPLPDTVTPVPWRNSRAVGKPFAGRLVRGVELPESGRDFFTWDPVHKRIPSRAWRRNGADDLIHVLLDVFAEYRIAHPDAPRVGVGDLSRPEGGVFDERFGGLGHASHQNGLDADVYYPRRDGSERRPYKPSQVDEELAQDLVDRFVAADAQYVFVGPRLSLTGPRKVVSKLTHHDDHLHVRLRP